MLNINILGRQFSFTLPLANLAMISKRRLFTLKIAQPSENLLEQIHLA